MNTATAIGSFVFALVIVLIIGALIRRMLRGWKHRGERQAELVGVCLDGRPADELSEDAIVEPCGVRLLRRDAAPGLLRDLVDLVLEGALILLETDLVVADLGDRTAAPTLEHVGDAPDGEAQHEHRK